MIVLFHNVDGHNVLHLQLVDPHPMGQYHYVGLVTLVHTRNTQNSAQCLGLDHKLSESLVEVNQAN